MEMEIKIKCAEKPNIQLVLNNDAVGDGLVEYVYIQVQPCEQHAWAIIPIEELKHALRKLSAK